MRHLKVIDFSYQILNPSHRNIIEYFVKNEKVVNFATT